MRAALKWRTVCPGQLEARARPEYSFSVFKVVWKIPPLSFSLLHSFPSLYSCLILTHMDPRSDWWMRPRSPLPLFTVNTSQGSHKKTPANSIFPWCQLRGLQRVFCSNGELATRHVAQWAFAKEDKELLSLCASGAAHGELFSNMSRRGEEGGCCLSSCPWPP